MLRNRKLARQISDASWSSLVNMLAYKARWNDRKVIKIPRWYPSSKTCHKCGWVKEDLELSIRPGPVPMDMTWIGISMQRSISCEKE